MLSKVFKETAIYAIGPQVPKIASFFILPIITKDLTSFDYGIAAIVSSYVGLIAAFQAVGLSDLFVNYFYRHPRFYKVIWRHLLGFLTTYSVFYALVQTVLLYFVLPIDFSQKILVIILNVIPVLLFENVNNFGSRFLQLHHKPGPIAIISAISGLIVVGSNLFFISYLKLGFVGWFASSLLGSLIQFIFYFHQLLKNQLLPIFKFRYRYIKRYLKISLPFVPNKYGHILLNSSDRVVMDLMKVSTSQIGFYNFGYNIGNYFQIIVSSFGIAISPFYLSLISTSKKTDLILAIKVTKYIQIIFIAGTFIGSLWMKELFEILVSNNELKLSYNIAIIIVMMQNYAPMRFFFTNFITYHEKTSFLWKITLLGGIINVILNIIVIFYYGIFAAAITTFITMFFISIAGFFHKEYLALTTVKVKSILWFAVSAIATVIVYSLKDTTIVNKIFLTLGSFFIFAIFYFKKNSLIKSN